MYWLSRLGRENIEYEEEDPPVMDFLKEREILAMFEVSRSKKRCKNGIARSLSPAEDSRQHYITVVSGLSTICSRSPSREVLRINIRSLL